jgi:hypothetical protein
LQIGENVTEETFSNIDEAIRIVGTISKTFYSEQQENNTCFSADVFEHPDQPVSYKALVTLGLRFCEPLNVMEFIKLESKSYKEKLNLALRAISKCNTIFPLSVQELAYFFRERDFNLESQLSFSVPQSITTSMHSAINGQETLTHNIENIRSKIVSAFKNVENYIQGTVITNIQEAFHLIKPCISSDAEIQVGLVLLAETVLTLPIIEEIWSLDFVKDQPLLDCAGTVLVAKIVECNPMLLQQLTKITSVQILSPDSISNKQKRILENVCSFPTFSGLRSDVIIHSDFDLVKKCIKATQSFVQIKELNDVSVENRICGVANCNINEIDSDNIQMPMITVARRISSPTALENVILLEYSVNKKLPKLVGLHILKEIIINLPYQILDLDLYIHEEDLDETNILKERLVLEEIAAKSCCINAPTEGVSVSGQLFANNERIFKKAVKDFIYNNDAITKSDVPICENMKLYDVFDTIQGQAYLFDMAKKLSDSITVNKILVFETLEKNDIPRFPGLFALKKVLELYPVKVECIEMLINDGLSDSSKVKNFVAVCQQISSCVKTFQESFN